MKWYLKYSRHYRIALICFIITIAAVISMATIGALTYSTPAPMFDATVPLFFIPTIVGAALIVGIYFWTRGENLRKGWDI